MRAKAILAVGILVVIAIASCQNDNELEYNRYYSTGAAVYRTHCVNCHGYKGEGLGLLIPPLTDTAYLKNNRAALACTVQFGIKGKITIANKIFEGDMPANNLAPIELAEVLTYINNSFGNKAGTTNLDSVTDYLKNCK